MLKRYTLKEISELPLSLIPGDIVFLHGDLAAGKTTLSKHLIQTLLWETTDIKSPTYTYYHKYSDHIYHFDLYRLSNYDEFFAIGGEEIVENPNNICLIEWPEILSGYITPTFEIFLKKTDRDDEREIEIKKI